MSLVQRIRARLFARLGAARLLRAVHRGLTGCEPDPEALKSLVEEFARTGDFAATLSRMARSEDFRRMSYSLLAPELVQAAYRTLLGRVADEEGLAAHAATLAGSQDPAALLSAIVDSEEFRQKGLAALERDLADSSHYAPEDLEAQKVVFLHHPKTGGTTLHGILLEAFDEERVCPERFNGLRLHPAGELARCRYFSGHYDLPSVDLIPGRKKVFTMLREPAARLVSLYHFLRAHEPGYAERNGLHLAVLANRHGMAGFFQEEEVRSNPWINDSMTRVLTGTLEGYRWEFRASPAPPLAGPSLPAAVRRLEALDAFGIMERFDDSVRLICTCLGIPVPAKVEPRQVLEVIMDETAGLRRIVKEPMTAEAGASIGSLVETDAELYRRACAIFEERLARAKFAEAPPRPDPEP